MTPLPVLDGEDAGEPEGRGGGRGERGAGRSEEGGGRREEGGGRMAEKSGDRDNGGIHTGAQSVKSATHQQGKMMHQPLFRYDSLFSPQPPDTVPCPAAPRC